LLHLIGDLFLLKNPNSYLFEDILIYNYLRILQCYIALKLTVAIDTTSINDRLNTPTGIP